MLNRSTPTVSHLLFRLLAVVAAITALAQLAIDTSLANLASVVIVLLSALSTLTYLERGDTFRDTPVSSLTVLGLCVTTQWAALAAQSLSGQGLTEGLREPILTFLLLAAVQAIALFSHWLYRHLAFTTSARQVMAKRVVAPIGGFGALPVPAVWTLAVFGMMSLAIGYADTGNIGGKLFQALSFFAWLPAIIPILHARYGESYCRLGQQVPFLVLYAALLVVIGMARNARGLMVVGPVQVLLVLLVYGLRDQRPTTRRLAGWLLVGAAAAAAGVYVARDLATAMVVVRTQRAVSTPWQMVHETIATLGERHKIELYRERIEANARYEVYDETYLSNPFLARFSETKFHDNMLAILLQLDEREKAFIAEMTRQKIVTILPQPAIDMLNLGLDKDKLFFSMGDVYRSLNEGEVVLGGFAAGSIWADMLAIFGVWAPFVTVPLFMAAYILLDALARVDRRGIDLSPVAVCTAWSIFLYGLGADSLVSKVMFFLRGYPEKLLLYVGAAWLVTRVFPYRVGPDARAPNDRSPLSSDWFSTDKAGLKR